MWQAILSVLIGVLGVFAALWAASKGFRVGLLMFGKPPSMATLVRWVRIS
jgi:ABC-2 type transport system permease protein